MMITRTLEVIFPARCAPYFREDGSITISTIIACSLPERSGSRLTSTRLHSRQPLQPRCQKPLCLHNWCLKGWPDPSPRGISPSICNSHRSLTHSSNFTNAYVWRSAGISGAEKSCLLCGILLRVGYQTLARLPQSSECCDSCELASLQVPTTVGALVHLRPCLRPGTSFWKVRFNTPPLPH